MPLDFVFRSWYKTFVMDTSTLGGKVREARQTAGLTLVQLADLLGVTQRAVQFWEADERVPSIESVRGIAAATGRPVDWFFREAA